jgi:hypothetical protein
MAESKWLVFRRKLLHIVHAAHHLNSGEERARIKRLSDLALKDARFHKELQRWWHAASIFDEDDLDGDGEADGDGQLQYAEYSFFHHRLVTAFNEKAMEEAELESAEEAVMLTTKQAEEALEQDWHRDSKGDGGVDHIDFYHSLAELAATWSMPEEEDNPAPDYEWFLHELHRRVFSDNIAKLRDDYILENHERWEQDETFINWAHEKFGSEEGYNSFVARVRDRKNRRFLCMAVKAFLPFVVGTKKDANGTVHSLTEGMAVEANISGDADIPGDTAEAVRQATEAIAGEDGPDFTLPLGGRAWAHNKSSRWTKTAQFSTLKSFFKKLAGSLEGEPVPSLDEPKVKVSVEVVRAKRLRVMDTKTGTSDPFVTLVAEDGGRKSKSQRTHVVSDSVNPEWKEKFEFDVADVNSCVIAVVVKDKDVSGSQRMGELKVELTCLADAGALGVRKRYKLHAPSDGSTSTSSPVTKVTIDDTDFGYGEVELVIRVVRDGEEAIDELTDELPPLRDEVVEKAEEKIVEKEGVEKRAKSKQRKGKRRETVSIKKRQAERKQQRRQQASKKKLAEQFYPDADWRFYQWAGKQDSDLDARGRGFSSRWVGEVAKGGGPLRHRIWSGRQDVAPAALGSRPGSGMSQASAKSESRRTRADSVGGSRSGSGVISLSLDDMSRHMSRPGPTNSSKISLAPLSTKIQKQRRQQLRAEYEFDPSILNLTRPTVASIVQRAPILPASRDVVERRAGGGRPIPVFKSDCAVADLGPDPYGCMNTTSVQGYKKRAPPQYEPGDPRIAPSLTYDAHGWSEARQFLQQLAR